MKPLGNIFWIFIFSYLNRSIPNPDGDRKDTLVNSQIIKISNCRLKIKIVFNYIRTTKFLF